MNVTLCLLYIIKIGLKSEVLLYHQGWCLLEQASGKHVLPCSKPSLLTVKCSCHAEFVGGNGVWLKIQTSWML